MSYSHNLGDEIQVKGLSLSNRKGCVAMISRCCPRDQNKLIPSFFPQVPCPLSMLLPTSNMQHQAQWVWQWCLQETRVLPLIYCLNCHVQSCISNGHRLCQAAESSASCKSLWFIGFVQWFTGWWKPRGSPGILGPSLSSHYSSAATKGQGQALVWQQLQDSCPGTKKIFWWTRLPPS